jgi:hypothetical protein
MSSPHLPVLICRAYGSYREDQEPKRKIDEILGRKEACEATAKAERFWKEHYASNGF